MSALNPEQVSRILKRPPKAKTVPPEEWDTALDHECAGMFGRRWGELEEFSPLAKKAYHCLNSTTLLGNWPETSDLDLLISIATTTASPVLREKAVDCLRKHLSDCSGDGEHKPRVRAAIDKLSEVSA